MDNLHIYLIIICFGLVSITVAMLCIWYGQWSRQKKREATKARTKHFVTFDRDSSVPEQPIVINEYKVIYFNPSIVLMGNGYFYLRFIAPESEEIQEAYYRHSDIFKENSGLTRDPISLYRKFPNSAKYPVESELTSDLKDVFNELIFDYYYRTLFGTEENTVILDGYRILFVNPCLVLKDKDSQSGRRILLDNTYFYMYVCPEDDDELGYIAYMLAGTIYLQGAPVTVNAVNAYAESSINLKSHPPEVAETFQAIIQKIFDLWYTKTIKPLLSEKKAE